MRHYIDIFSREAAPNGNDIDILLDPKLRVKAAIDFIRGSAITGNTNIEITDTAVFTIRNTKNVAVGDLVVFEKIIYAVTRVAPTDGYKWFLRVTCTERGLDTNDVNLI